MIKAILLLEDAGLQVMALTCDVASTNKTMVKELGISGKRSNLKHFFINPYDDQRNIYVFIDAPHTIKNIRNRLFQQKQLKARIQNNHTHAVINYNMNNIFLKFMFIFQTHPSKMFIRWDHYCNVFNNDSKNMLKICPKVTRHHIELNNLTKMKVKYATQVKFCSYNILYNSLVTTYN